MGGSPAPTRRGLFAGAGALLAGLAAAGLPATVEAEAADPNHSWAAFLPVFSWMHEDGRAVGQRAQAAGFRLEDLFCIVLEGGAAPSLLFKDPVTGASTTVDAVGVH